VGTTAIDVVAVSPWISDDTSARQPSPARAKGTAVPAQAVVGAASQDPPLSGAHVSSPTQTSSDASATASVVGVTSSTSVSTPPPRSTRSAATAVGPSGAAPTAKPPSGADDSGFRLHHPTSVISPAAAAVPMPTTDQAMATTAAASSPRFLAVCFTTLLPLSG
jgi:hypothetical protein